MLSLPGDIQLEKRIEALERAINELVGTTAALMTYLAVKNDDDVFAVVHKLLTTNELETNDER